MKYKFVSVTALIVALTSANLWAQARGGGAAGAAGQRGEAPQPPQTPRAMAPIDLTGYWVSIVTEDWRFRMVTPPKGDFASVPLNQEGIRVGNQWDPAKDEAASEQCKSYGRSGHHACAGTRAYHVGKRYDVEGRNGRRPTDSPLSFRRVPATSNSSDLAGEFGSILGNGQRRARTWRALRRFFEGCDERDARGIPEKERRSVQRKSGCDGILRSHHRAEWRYLAHRHDCR